MQAVRTSPLTSSCIMPLVRSSAGANRKLRLVCLSRCFHVNWFGTVGCWGWKTTL